MKTIIVLAGAVFVAASPARADTESAIRAYDAGLYDVASSELLRHAEDPEAMYRLGEMYAEGIWFQHDHVRAEHWLNQAALLGHQKAREKLAEIAAEKR